mmetsp:Transcript_1876/g.3743  ORF Transcript_1876/g.3743 Transcript_1876/m.3743 type:complete len:295 (-) Transcript_1876:1029-1913(-)
MYLVPSLTRIDDDAFKSTLTFFSFLPILSKKSLHNLIWWPSGRELNLSSMSFALSGMFLESIHSIKTFSIFLTFFLDISMSNCSVLLLDASARILLSALFLALFKFCSALVTAFFRSVYSCLACAISSFSVVILASIFATSPSSSSNFLAPEPSLLALFKLLVRFFKFSLSVLSLRTLSFWILLLSEEASFNFSKISILSLTITSTSPLTTRCLAALRCMLAVVFETRRSKRSIFKSPPPILFMGLKSAAIATGSSGRPPQSIVKRKALAWWPQGMNLFSFLLNSGPFSPLATS